MTAKIYTFPEIKRKPLTKYVVSIPLYSDAEIDTVIIAVNLYVVDDIRYSSYNIDSLDPDTIIQCLDLALQDNVLSTKVKKIIKKIIKNVEYL